MKKTTATLFLLLPLLITAQENLVPNPGFENGTISDCNWPTYLNLNPNIPRPEKTENWFNLAVDNWFVAKHNNDKGEDVGNYLDIDLNDCYSKYIGSCTNVISPFQTLLPSKRFVDIFASFRKNKMPPKSLKQYQHCAIRAHLFEALDIGATYILRIKFVALAGTGNKTRVTYNGKNHLKIHFTKWGPHWDSNSNNNQKFLHAVDIIKTKPGINCSWEFEEREFTVPNDNDHDQLQYMIIYVEEGRFIIDDVVVFKKCPDEMLIENKEYDFYFYDPTNSNIPFVNHASNIVKAGYDAGAPTANGNVIVQQSADVTFRAGNRIELLPGFSTELGANFMAEINPCTGQGGKKGNDESNDYLSIETNEEDQIYEPKQNAIDKTSAISIYPNPTSGEFQLTLDSEREAQVYIYDIFGRLIYNKQIGSLSNQHIDISERANGIYLVKVILGEEVFIQKLILE